MPLKVSFMTPAYAGAIENLALGFCRACETLTVGVVSTLTARDGEIMMLLSTETAAIVVAVGSVPNGAAQVATAATSAGVPLAPNTLVPMQCRVGDKIEFEAFV